MRRRFLSRDEWPLIAVGVMAGVLTSALILYFFFTGLDGGGVDPGLVADPELGRIERDVPDRFPVDGPGRGVIGARESRISARLDGMRVPVRPLRGPLAVTLRDVSWNDPSGARFARAELATGRLGMTPLMRGDVILDQVVVRRPVVGLRQAAPGATWNFEQVFAELLEGDGRTGPQRTIQVRNLRVLDGTVEVTRPGQRFAFHDVQAGIPLLVLSQPGVPEPYVRVASMTTRFVQPDPAASLSLDVSDALVRFPTGRVQFDIAAATLDRTRVAAVQGIWDPADPGYGITAEGRALELYFADVAFLLPEGFPSTGTAAFAWSVRPLPGDLTEATLTELDARSGESRVLGSLTVQFGDEHFALLAADLRLDPLQLALVEGFTGELPYGGTVSGRVEGSGGDIVFDLVATLTSPTVAGPFRVGLAGGVLLTSDGLALRRAVVDLQRVPLAALRAVLPALPLDGVVSGTVALSGPPTRAPLDVDVRLEVGAGVVVAGGVIDLTGATPRYDLSGRLLGVEVQAFLAPEAPPVAVTAAFSLRGTGTDPATLEAAVRVAGRFTGWEAAPGDTIDVVADVSGGALRLRPLHVRLATARLEASGTWRFVEPQSGSIAYDLAVTSLRPWGPYIPVLGGPDAAGGLFAVGTVTGSLERLRLAGGATGVRLVVGEWAARSIVAEYDVEAGGGTLPFAVVDASATGLQTPTAGDFPTARLALRLTPPGLIAELDAARPDGSAIQLAATGNLPDVGEREIVLQRVRLDVADGEWILQRPAYITWLGDDLFVRGFELVDARTEGRVAIEGQIRPPLGIDARIEVAAFPTGDVQRLLGQPPRLEGRLWVDATVRGALDDPLVDVTFRVEDGAIAEVPVRELRGTAVYRDRLTAVDAVAVVEPDGRLDVQARLPSVLQLEGSPLFALIDGVPLSGLLRAERFALAPLGAFFPEVRDLAGVVNAHVDLSGTAENPVVEGVATLEDGAFTAIALNQRYDRITGEVSFDGRRLVIRDLRARSDGWVVAGGAIVLERLDQPVLDLQFTLDGFRPVGVENQRDAAAFGRLSLTGAPTALVLTGDLRVDDGYVAIPQFGGGPGADLLDITRPAPVIGETVAPPENGGVLENLQVQDLRLTAGEGAWFLMDEARAQLSGTLVVNRVGPNMPIVGVLEGTRGQYTLLAGPIVRRFEIVSAQVRFLGAPQPNPALDITARRIVFDPGGRELPVDVRITGTLENPRIAVAGGEAVDIAEAELLSLLLFGQPSFALGGQFLPGEELLQQTLLGGAAELLAIELERSLAGLGLDIFQIRLGHGAMGGLATPTVVMGRQLREDVFLTVETGITALMGGAGTTQTTLGTWAIRLDWAFDPRSRLRLAVEPVFTGRGLRGAPLALPLTDPRQQLLVELRRRWTY